MGRAAHDSLRNESETFSEPVGPVASLVAGERPAGSKGRCPFVSEMGAANPSALRRSLTPDLHAAVDRITRDAARS
jgi:hypothetical protein